MPVYVGVFDGEHRWPSANFFDFMHGGSSFVRATGLLEGVPLLQLAVMLAVATGLIVVAGYITTRQEF
jgi:hypothetical protein